MSFFEMCMKLLIKSFLFFFLVLTPLPKCEATGYHSKQKYLDLAHYKMSEAKVQFILAESEANFIPDIDIQGQMKILITSSISSIPIPDPKAKIITVALALIGNLVADYGIEIYEKLSSLFISISRASAAIEMANYYQRLAINAPITTCTPETYSKAVAYFHEAINSLIRVDMHATTVQYRPDGIIVSDFINTIRNSLISEFEINGKLIKPHYEELDLYLENFDEVAAECLNRDPYIVELMFGCIQEAKLALKDAEMEWGLRPDPRPKPKKK